MPDYTIAPDSYLLIWADDEEEQGAFHANFKLGKDGEEIGIFGPETMGFPVIDSLTYGQQQQDISMGRISDGDDEWKFFNEPTPGYSNESGASIGEYVLLPALVFYPNPCKNGILFLEQEETVCIFDMSGKFCLSVENTNIVDVEQLGPGIYIIVTMNHRPARLIII